MLPPGGRAGVLGSGILGSKPQLCWVLLLISHMPLVRKGKVPFLEGLLCAEHCVNIFHVLVIPLICIAALQEGLVMLKFS